MGTCFEINIQDKTVYFDSDGLRSNSETDISVRAALLFNAYCLLTHSLGRSQQKSANRFRVQIIKYNFTRTNIRCLMWDVYKWLGLNAAANGGVKQNSGQFFEKVMHSEIYYKYVDTVCAFLAAQCLCLPQWSESGGKGQFGVRWWWERREERWGEECLSFRRCLLESQMPRNKEYNVLRLQRKPKMCCCAIK